MSRDLVPLHLSPFEPLYRPCLNIIACYRVVVQSAAAVV
jgi:hypothetical protein